MSMAFNRAANAMDVAVKPVAPRPVAADQLSAEPLTQVDAILFDAGDILYQRRGKRVRTAAFLAARGLALPGRDEGIKARKIEAWRGRIARKDYFRTLLVAAGLDDAEAIEEGCRLLAADQDDVVFFDGVAETLHRLKRQGYRLGIVTNTHETIAEKMAWFARIGIDGLFDAYVSSCDTGLVKPEPGIYLRALSDLDVAPARAVFVAHSGKEIDGARACGLRTIAFNADGPIPQADRLLATFDDLARMVAPGQQARERAQRPLIGPAGLPTVAAHRGGALLWPENSATAFRGAIGLKAELIETDVHLSADGEMVIIHDATLDRTTDGQGPVAAQTMAELKRLKLNGAADDTVLTLAEFLALLEGVAVDLRLELKVDAAGQRYPELARRCLTEVARHGLLERTTISSFHWPYLAQCLTPAPPKGLIALVRRRRLADEPQDALLAEAAASGARELAVPISALTPDLIAAAARHGLRTGAYAVRTEGEVEQALAAEITTFTTDRPDIAMRRRRALQQQRLVLGRRHPALG